MKLIFGLSAIKGILTNAEAFIHQDTIPLSLAKTIEKQTAKAILKICNEILKEK